MNLNLQTIPCDAEQLESFLAGDLSEIQERDFTLHLSSCENCRRSLQDRAAEPEAWQEAEKLLRPSEFELETESRSQSQPLQIQNVLAALGPTDDPAMLGRLGGYEVSGVVGAGGMGVVLKAIDKSLDRTVAIKVLAPHLATSGAARKRFAREAKAAAAVLHPNVIAIHSVSNEQSLPYLVMPYVRGTSLQKRLDAEGPLSLQEVLRIGSQVAAGLAAAHAQGLVHRDIKPANILLEEGVERVTITDFGLARAVDDASITHSGTIAGTPQYMSPEQARGEAVDGRSDLFSLGSVLYAICTGRPPFRAETSYGVLRRITDDEPTPIREINSDVPAWLCSIIARLMSKPAEHRFQSAAEVSDLFEKCLAHVQQPATVPLPESLATKPKRVRLPKLSRLSLGALATIAAFGLGLLGIALWNASEAPDIAGKWTGPEWGEVALKQKEPGEYEGTYTDTFKQKPGKIQLKWSRLEKHYKGTWQEGQDRHGRISVRLIEGEVRGAWSTSEKSSINPGNPELSELLWKRSSGRERGDEFGEGANSVQKSDKELLQGFWTLQESYGDGKKLGDDDKSLWPHELWIHDNEYTELFTINGKRSGGQSGGTLVLDQIQKPKQITIVSAGSERRGIYKLEGDSLTICWAEVKNGSNGKDTVRPDEFRTFPDSARLLHVYKLKKQVLVDIYDFVKIKNDAGAKVDEMAKSLSALPKVMVSFRESGKPDSPPTVVIRDPHDLLKRQPTLKAAINDAIRNSGISEVRWEADKKTAATPAKEIQVSFASPAKLGVAVADERGQFDKSPPFEVPFKMDLAPSKIYRLKLTKIDGREGTELYPTLEVGPTTPRTDAFLAHNAIPVQFTDEDFDQVLAGTFVTKVMYLPDPAFQGLALGTIETLVSTRLDPGKDPILEADRRGSILAVIRLGNKDVEVSLQWLAAAAKKFNDDTVQVRKELFTPPIPDLTPERLREGFRQSADVYRRQGKRQVADALLRIAETGRLPREASDVIATGVHAKDENGQTISRQVVPGLILPDETTSTGNLLVVLQPLQLMYRKDGPVSKDYGDLFDGEKVLQPDEKTPIKADANEPQAEFVINLGFERNGLGSLASASPVLLQKGRVVQASDFKAYLEKEKLALTRQHGDAAATTTIRLNVDRDVQFDAVTALMKLCQEVGFQKFTLRLADEAVEKYVLEILRTPFNFDPAKGSWQDGAYEAQVLMSLNMVQPRDRAVKTLLKVVDRSEKGTMDQRRLAMMSLGGLAPQQVIPHLIKELEGAKNVPVGQFKESFPYHEISVLEQIGEEAKEAIPVLIKILDTPDGLACQSALFALVKIGPSSDEVMNAIAARFGKPEEPVWSRAVYEVGRYGKQAKPLGLTFVKLLSAKPKEARVWAAQALVKSGFDEARGFDELMKDVAAGTSADRGLAALALAALGSQAKPMIPKLRAFENDPDAHVAKEVRDAIRRIEKDDRIFTHAEEAAKTAASRKASAAALDLLSAETKAILVNEEYQRFEGTWRISLRTIDRAVSLGEFGKDGKHIIKDRQMGDAQISLDPSKTPREIDLTFTGGPDKGKVLRGIYEWVDDAKKGKLLRISVGTRLYQTGDKDARRPKDFEERSAIDFAIWERIVAGDPKSVDSTSKGDELRFSETKEVVLSMDSLRFMLDLDTGKTMDPPATIRPEQEQMDLQTDQVQPYHYPTKLTGRGLVGLEVKSSDWDASAKDVRLALTSKAVEPLKEMDLGPEKNPTYFFKTRDGTLGVLQLLELVEKPKGIRLRYKTMGGQSERPAQGNNGNRDVETGVKTDAAHPPSGDEAKRIVERMRGISMQLASRSRSDGKPDPQEERKQEIMDQLRQLGAKAIPALVLALGDSDVQMRRNAELVMIHLAGPYGKPRVDIKEALPALLKATEDPDSDVRAWAAHAIAEIGPGAKEAVPALIKLLQGKDEGGRNTSCMALGAIGPAAKEALPALRNALDDPRQDVRKFTEAAIKRIELPADAKAAEGQKGIADPNVVAKPNWARQLGTVEGLKSIAYSPDGKFIAAANGNVSFPVAEGWKRAVVILDAETGTTVLSLPLATKEENAILAATEGLPHFEVGPLAFSPNGSLLAVGTGLGQVKLINPKNGELVSSLDDEPAKLAEKATPEKLKSLKRAMGGVGSLAFSPDGTLLAMTGSSFDDAARNWGDVRRLGRRATGPGRLKVWDVKTGALKHDLAGHSHAFAAAFSADGSLLVSTGRGLSEGGNDNGVIVWNPQTGEKLRTIPIEANGGTHAVVFSPTKKLVAVASRTFDKENDTSSTSIRLLYPLSGITEWDRNFPGWASPKAFLPDGSGVGVLCGGDSIKFLSVETAADLFEIHPTDAKAKSSWIDFALAPQTRKLAIGGTDKKHIGSVEIWDLGSADTAKPPAPPLQETEKK